jgi:hypothetical protein
VRAAGPVGQDAPRRPGRETVGDAFIRAETKGRGGNLSALSETAPSAGIELDNPDRVPLLPERPDPHALRPIGEGEEPCQIGTLSRRCANSRISNGVPGRGS